MTLLSRVAALAALSLGCGTTTATPIETAPVSRVSRPAASPAVLQGEQLLAKGQVKEAWAILEDAVEDEPDDPRAWLDLGLVYEEVGDLSAAERAYRRSTELDGRFAEAFNNLGVLLRERGDLSEAVTMLERAVDLDPVLGPARFNLALAYEDLGDGAAAEEQYLAAIDVLKGDPVPRINLAMLYLDEGRADEAKTQLREAIPRVEGDVLLSVAVGNALRRAGDSSAAVEVLHAALAHAPDPPPTGLLAELALALFANGDLPAAESVMRRAVGQEPADPALQYALGTMLAKQGFRDEARRHLSRVVTLDPDGPLAERAKAQLRAISR
ncbi:MAG: tetratricopeptide repeat protein [Polyangiales bacterium]